MSYDLLRSTAAGDFSGSAICLESADTDLVATDSDLPGAVFYYLARARNSCAAGTSGTDSAGTPRSVPVCP